MNKTEIISCTIAHIERKIEEQAEQELALDKIAEKIGYSKFYLNRIFQEEVGSTIHQYIMDRRLSEASRKLVYTEKQLIDIAYETGYRSQQAFTNAFSHAYHCSPLDYRAGGRWNPLRRPYLISNILRMNVRYKMEMAA